MPEYESDRQLVLQDFKNRLLDLSEMNLTLPATDIYDEPVRYYKANLQWTPIIEGFLDWLADIASWKDAQDENYPAIQQLLKYLEGVEVAVAIDCNEVENCITISPTVINISNEVTNNSTEITNINSSVTNINNTVNNINNTVNNITENSIYNELPPPPNTVDEVQNYCGASWGIAEGLEQLIQEVLADALTLTFSDFIQERLNGGGIIVTLMRAFWDWAVAIANPNISAEVTASIPYVAEAIYCANLDLEQAKLTIDQDTRIPNDSQIAYMSAIDSLTASKLNSLLYIGSLDTSRDCGVFTPCAQWANFMDFEVAPYSPVAYAGTYSGGYWESENVGGNSQLILGFRFAKQTFKYAYYDAWKIDHASILHSWQVWRDGVYVTGGGINNNVRPRQFIMIANTQNNIDEFRLVWQASGLDKKFRLYSMKISGIGLNPQMGVNVTP